MDTEKKIQTGMWMVVLLSTMIWTGETMMWIVKNKVPDIPIAFFIIPPLMFVALFGMMLSLTDPRVVKKVNGLTSTS